MKVKENFDKYRALHAKWLNLMEASYYCCCSIPHFCKGIRQSPFVHEIGPKPVIFDREELDLAMEAKKIGNPPRDRVPTSVARKRR